MQNKNIIFNEFKPSWWIKNRHLQTMWARLFKRPAHLNDSQRYRLELEDTDFIDVDVFPLKDRPTLLLLHGLEGSIESPYIKGMIHAAKSRKWQVVVMHFRSCSGEENRLLKSYHNGVSDDLQLVLEKLQEINITVDYITGFSLGGNVLLKWLGENSKCSSIKAAAVVSVPMDVAICATEIHRGFSKLYEFVLLKTLKNKTRKKILKFGSRILPNAKQLSKLTSFRLFDDQVTAPVHGFKNAQDYYEKVSSKQFIKNIKIPTLIIHAKDDPFMNIKVLPHFNEIPKNITLEINDHGGHVGFVQVAWPWKVEYYLEKRIPDYFENLMGIV